MNGKSNALIVLAKFPRSRAVKTRLEPVLGDIAARTVAEMFLVDIVERFLSARNLRIIVAGSAQDTESEFGELFQKHGLNGRIEIYLPRTGSMEGDILSAYEFALRKSSKAVLTASDLPYLSRSMVNRLFKALDTHDLVLHPNVDGNARPHGMKTVIDLFTDTKSRSADYLSEWLNRIRLKKLSYKMFPILFDIDRADDLRMFYNWQLMLEDAEEREQYCPRTVTYLKSLYNA